MSPMFGEERPSRLIILFAVAAVEGGVVFDGALDGAAGLGVVGNGAREAARREGLLHGDNLKTRHHYSRLIVNWQIMSSAACQLIYQMKPFP